MDDFVKLIKSLQQEHADTEPLVTAEVVAAKMGVSKWTVYKLAQSGRIPSVKFGGSRRFLLSTL
jgi:excisionase family DNA binding protein